MYIKYLPEKDIDELTINMEKQYFEENQELFKQNEIPPDVFILVSGKIEIYLTISEGELYLDTLEEVGSVLNQISILNKQKMTYSARAKTDVEVLTMSYEKLMQFRDKN